MPEISSYRWMSFWGQVTAVNHPQIPPKRLSIKASKRAFVETGCPLDAVGKSDTLNFRKPLYPSKQLRSELKQVTARPPGGSAMENPGGASLTA
jgi:hypothetical protein